MASKPYRQALFVKADGGPMYFAMVPCPERKEIRELVQNGGGVLLQPGKNPDAVHLVPTSIATTQGPEDVFSANYIRACCSSNKLFPLKDFKIPRAPEVVTVEDGDDCKERKLRSVRSRREYTLGEQIAIAKYVAKTPSVRVRGNQVYKEMATAGVVPGAHSWQSLKEHYLKKILPWKHLYESPDASTLFAKSKDAPHETQDWPRHASPSATSGYGPVIVEDSSSDDEQLPKRQTGGGVEEGKWDTDTEVVLETESQGDTSSLQCRDTPVTSQRSRGRSKTKRKKLLLSSSFFDSSPEKSSGGSHSRHKIGISALRKKSCDDTSTGSGVVPEKSAEPPPRTQSETSHGETPHTKTQSPPGKRDDGVGGEGAQAATVLETVVKQKQSLRSSPRKGRNAKQRKTPADDHGAHEKYTSANVHNVPHNDLPERLSVLESVGEQQTTRSTPQNEAGAITPSKHSSGPPSPSQHLQSRDCAASEVFEEWAPRTSKLRSFRLPARKKRSTESQANPSSCLSGPSRHKIGISALRKKSCNDTSIGSGVVPEKSHGETPHTKTQSPPGKRDDGVGGEGTQAATVLETVVKQKQSLRSSPRKGRNAKQRKTPADDHGAHEKYTSANVHNVPHNDLPERLSVLESVGKQQTTRSAPQKEAGAITPSKHSSGPPSPSQHLQSRDCAASEVCEEWAPRTSKLRSFRLPVRKKRSTESQANPRSCLSALLASESSDDETAADESPRKRASRRRRPSRLSPRKRQRATAQQTNLDDRLGELAHSESIGDGITTMNASRSSPESIYNTAESEGATQGTKCTRGGESSVLFPQKEQRQVSDLAATKTRKRSLRAVALRRNDATSPASEHHCTRSTRLAESREKEQKSAQGVAHETSGFDSSDEALLTRIAEQVSAGQVTAGDDSDDQDDATTVSFSSGGGHSDEESTPELEESSEHDRMDEVHQELCRSLGVMREGRSRPPHATCSPQCTCPLTKRYAQAARAAVSLTAFLAFHNRPLPPEGITDPAVAMTLELLLRHLEQGADERDGSGLE